MMILPKWSPFSRSLNPSSALSSPSRTWETMGTILCSAMKFVASMRSLCEPIVEPSSFWFFMTSRIVIVTDGAVCLRAERVKQRQEAERGRVRHLHAVHDYTSAVLEQLGGLAQDVASAGVDDGVEQGCAVLPQQLSQLGGPVLSRTEYVAQVSVTNNFEDAR